MLTPVALDRASSPSLAGRLAIFLVRVYQHTFGILFGGHCRYYPSCSQYAIRAFRKYGFLTALRKTVWRLLRCNPFSKGGVDLP